MKQIIIGIDPGSYNLGIAIISIAGDFIYSETIKVPSKLSEVARLAYIKGKIRSLLRRILYSSEFNFCKINKILYEDPHIQNSSVTKLLSQVIGAIATEIYEQTSIEAKPVSPISARTNLGLKKNSSKDDVRNRIEQIIGKDNLSQHEIDAVLIALAGAKDGSSNQEKNKTS